MSSSFKVLTDSRMREEVLFATASNGMQIAFWPKKGFSTSAAYVGLRYGSTDTRFRIPSGEVIEVPDGSAHFLEHKLFEGSTEKVFDRFGKIGAQFNGGTGFRSTNYWFASADRFEEGLDILLDFIQNPLITEERVEKEKGIIEQEVLMYEDRAPYRGLFLLHRAMYSNHPIRQTPGGSVEEVRRTTAEHLQNCFDAFYRPQNLCLSLSGDFDPEEVLAFIEERLSPARPGEAERLYPSEPTAPAESRLLETFPVSRPHVWLGYRDKEGCGLGRPALERIVSTSLLLDLAFDLSSPLYEDIYLSGAVDDSLSWHYSSDSDWGHAIISGLSDEPDRFLEGVRSALAKLVERGVRPEDLERVRRASWGNLVSGLQTPVAMAGAALNAMLTKRSPFETLDVLEDLSVEAMNARAQDFFCDSQSSVSVLKAP